MRLLDRRQVEISRLTSEWKGLADKLETTSSAKQEIQVGKVVDYRLLKLVDYRCHGNRTTSALVNNN